MNVNLQHPGLLLPALPNQLPSVPGPWSLYPSGLPVSSPAPPLATVPGGSIPPGSAKALEMSERDARLLKRKQANRDSARRSKLKKKQEKEELVVRRTQLLDTHSDLVKRVWEAQARVRHLQEKNVALKEQFTQLLKASESS